VVTPATQAQDQPDTQILNSPPSPVSNPTSTLPSPVTVSPTPEEPHEPQASTSTAAPRPRPDPAPPRPRPLSQSTFRHVGPPGTTGRLYTPSPLRSAHLGLPAGAAGAGPSGNGTVFRTFTSSTGNTPTASPLASPGGAHTLPRTFTLSQTRTSSPLVPPSVVMNNGSPPVIPIGQRGGIAAAPAVSSRLASPARPTSAAPSTSPPSRLGEAAAPHLPSTSPTPSPTPSAPQKSLPSVPQTPPPQAAALPRPGHAPTHSNILPVHLPSQHASSTTPASRSATPVSTPPRASGNAPYRAGFQPKGVYRSHTDVFLESRTRKRESGRVEERRLERRLDKVRSIAIREHNFFNGVDTDFFSFCGTLFTAHRFALPQSHECKREWTQDQIGGRHCTYTFTTRFQFL
jgi:rabenosyn-5